MTAKLLSAFGYQGDALNIAVKDSETSAAFYAEKFGFEIVERTDEPYKTVFVERDGLRMGLAENGGDPEQDGCAFHTDDIEGLRNEFVTNGLTKIGEIDAQKTDSDDFRVFFVVAPDGLCFWFGERQ